VAQQAHIQKIRCPRQELERRKVSFVEWSRIRPDPANTVFLQKPDELWAVPSGITKFNGETEICWQLTKKIPQCQLAFLWGERRWRLNQDHSEFGSKRFNGMEERV